MTKLSTDELQEINNLPTTPKSEEDYWTLRAHTKEIQWLEERIDCLHSRLNFLEIKLKCQQ